MLVGALMCQGGLAFAKDFDIEDEVNDTRGQADKYSVYTDKEVIIGTINEDDKHDYFEYDDHEYVIGNVSEKDQDDYFEFVAKRDGEMDLYFKFDDRRGSEDLVINLFLLDSSGKEVDSWYNSDGSTKFSFDVNRDDSYYLHVEYVRGVMTEPYYIKYDIDTVQ